MVVRQFVQGDIQSADLMRFLLVSEEIDTIMHFAAQVCTSVFCREERCHVIDTCGQLFWE